MINNLIKPSQQYSHCSHRVRQDRESATIKRKLKWLQQDGVISLNIIYPIQLKYSYINELLHHLVATINKSAYISFLVKVEFYHHSPLSLTFYYTALSSPRVANRDDREDIMVNSNSLMGLTDLIYQKILFMCENHSIDQSAFSWANKLLQYIVTCSYQQKLFLSQIEYLAGHPHEQDNHHQSIMEICQ